MKSKFGPLSLTAIFLAGAPTIHAQSLCTPGYSASSPNLNCVGSCSPGPGPISNKCALCKSVTYAVTFPDLFQRHVSLVGFGAWSNYFDQCESDTGFVWAPQRVDCWPVFYTPLATHQYFQAESRDTTCNLLSAFCGVTQFTYLVTCPAQLPGPSHTVDVGHQCPNCPLTSDCSGLCEGGTGDPADPCLYPSGCTGGYERQGNCCCPATPIIIDIDGNDYSLTSVPAGVEFDINGDGTKEQVSWTTAYGTAGFLVLDRNGNGRIDDASELFGNYTSQPTPSEGMSKNGFLALAVFDSTDRGGNNDGKISDADAIFDQLRLWMDRNHDGSLDPGELTTMGAARIAGIDLSYKESRRVDPHGNQFRYRAKILRQHGSDASRWAWDVLLKSAALPRSR